MTRSRGSPPARSSLRRRSSRRCCCCAGAALHAYKLRFQNAGQLVKGDDVQVGGRRVGNVKQIELTDDNQAEMTIERRRRLRAAARGDDRDHPRDVAVGHRQPLHRADARRPTTGLSSTTAPR